MFLPRHGDYATTSVAGSIFGQGFLIASCNLIMHPLGPLTEPRHKAVVSISLDRL